MAMERKPPITCHVLDTTIGKPGANIPVTLTLHPSSSSSSTTSQSSTFTSTTNPDGRITSWLPTPSAPFTSPTPLETLFQQPGDQRYSLTFNTEEYFKGRGVETFFPEIEVKFVVREEQRVSGEHFHVPVLVGGFGYSTYRGS